MAIPDFQSLMRPVLVALSDGTEHSLQTLRDRLAREYALTPEDLAETLPSGRVTVFANRVSWAISHMKGAAVVESPRRATYRITARGQQVLSETEGRGRVDLRTLGAFPEYQEFRGQGDHAGRTQPGTAPPVGAAEMDGLAETPAERMNLAYQELRRALAADLLERIGQQTPEFFEQLVLDVLRAMGYGGSHADSADRLGRSGDGGVDGVIREDKLGLDQIYVQAKRWSGPVGRPAIQQFVGALNGQRATKGVFITTSTFSREAHEYADSVNPRVVLVDGLQLAGLMIDHDVGVSIETTYPIRKIDLDYFGVEEVATAPTGNRASATE